MKITFGQTTKTIYTFFSLAIVFAISILFSSPVKAATSSFYTSGGGKVNTNQTISVSVSVTGSESYNAVETTVNFNNLVFVGASATGGWTTFAGPARSGNSVTYTGALFGSSTTGSKGVLNLTFRAPSNPGTATISAAGTITILNGNAKVSGGGNTATFTVVTPPPAPSPSPTPKPAPNVVNVSSSTHPDAASWYKSKEIVLTWNKQDGVTDFSTSFDSVADSNPGDVSSGSDTTKTVSATADGTYYFHIKAKNDVGWGPVSHYTIKIDSIAPDPFTTTKIGEESSSEFTLYFATTDATSNVAKYTVTVDGEDKGEQKSGLLKVSRDAKLVVVTAHDRAGNTTQTTLDLQKAPVSTIIDPNTSGTQTQQTITVEKTTSNKLLTTVLAVLAVLFAIYAGVITYFYFKTLDRKKNSEPTKTTESIEASPLQ